MSQWNDLSATGGISSKARGESAVVPADGRPNNFPSVNFVDNTDTMQIATAGAKARPITVVGVVKNTVADDAAYHMAVTFNAQRTGLAWDWTGANNTFIARDDAAIMGGTTVAGDTTTYHVESFVAQPVGASPAVGQMAPTLPSPASRARIRIPMWMLDRGRGSDRLDRPCVRSDGVHGRTERPIISVSNRPSREVAALSTPIRWPRKCPRRLRRMRWSRRQR